MQYVLIILVQDFTPLKIKITQFHDGFRLKLVGVLEEVSATAKWRGGFLIKIWLKNLLGRTIRTRHFWNLPSYRSTLQLAGYSVQRCNYSSLHSIRLTISRNIEKRANGTAIGKLEKFSHVNSSIVNSVNIS